MALDFLPFALPDIGQEEIDEVVDTLRSNWITTGPKAAQFEKDFAEFIGCKHALAVNSCTAGLHLALDAVGVVGGDLVLTTPYTFTATAGIAGSAWRCSRFIGPIRGSPTRYWSSCPATTAATTPPSTVSSVGWGTRASPPSPCRTGGPSAR